MSDATATVYWEDDPTKTRKVRRICAICQRIELREYGQMLSTRHVMLVSPGGVGHGQHGYETDRTSCGKNATGLEWWWRT